MYGEPTQPSFAALLNRSRVLCIFYIIYIYIWKCINSIEQEILFLNGVVCASSILHVFHYFSSLFFTFFFTFLFPSFYLSKNQDNYDNNNNEA